ncbi:MAG: hypothetical protein GY749_37265 [Desulfobacteraceae bacterium]|nr:hypothetical protein [Desulfobacteraceae bacterium]
MFKFLKTANMYSAFFSGSVSAIGLIIFFLMDKLFKDDNPTTSLTD